MLIITWVTFGIAVIGFGLSIFNFVSVLIANHKRIRVSVKEIYNEKEFTVMLLEFTNKSQLGISITSGAINDMPIGERAATLYTFSNPELNQRPTIKVSLFPLYICPLGSSRVLLRSERVLPESDAYKLVLGSSRGKISKDLTLPKDCGCFVSLLEYLE